MKFFVPQASRSEYQSAYEGIAKAVKDQLRVAITDRRIFSIEFIQDKKNWRAEVGQPDPQQGRYEVIAIFESKPHIIFTKAADGSQGLTILISNDDITKVEDFEPVKEVAHAKK